MAKRAFEYTGGMVTIRPDLVGSCLDGAGDAHGFWAERVIDITDECKPAEGGRHKPAVFVKYGHMAFPRRAPSPVAYVHNYGHHAVGNPHLPSETSYAFSNPGQTVELVRYVDIPFEQLVADQMWQTIDTHFPIDPRRLAEIVYANAPTDLLLRRRPRVYESPLIRAYGESVDTLRDILCHLLSHDYGFDVAGSQSVSLSGDFIHLPLIDLRKDMHVSHILWKRNVKFSYEPDPRQWFPGKFVLSFVKDRPRKRMSGDNAVEHLVNWVAKKLNTIIKNVGEMRLDADSINGPLLPEAIMLKVAVVLRLRYGVTVERKFGDRGDDSCWWFSYKQPPRH